MLSLQERVSNRGPDGTYSMDISQDLTFSASLLSLRGDPTFMPLSDEDGNVLVFNGQVRECFRGWCV